MADNIITTNITAHADFTSLRAQLAAVTAQLVKLQETTAGTNAKLANQIAVMNKSFATTLSSTGQFSQHFVSLSSDVDKFGKNLDRGRLKLNDYYNAWSGHTKKTSTLIRDLAKQQVMLQQAIVQPVGKNAQGHMQYNVMVAKGLDEIKNKMAIARQEAAIMNKVMLDGSTGLINWGKNTQWAGRQLTVGLTVPLVMFGAAAQKAFREADAELVRLTKVYGGLAATSSADLAQVRKDVTATAREIAGSYGVAYKETIALAADLAATGQQGNDLIAATQQTTRLAVLGEVDRQDAMKATLAIQNAFKQSTDELAQSIDFLNAVENQTSTSLSDLTEAIPKAGPVIKSLGGDVKDLALYLTAMKEGGVNASEGANAIKSAMASLINPTKVATEQFMGFGIDLKGIVNDNAGDLTATILSLQAALDNLTPLDKSRAIEQLFGKFQFARMSALFENLGKSGSQTLQVMDLMKASVTDLAAISERELKMMTESASGQFKRAWASVQADLAGAGEQFLRISTKVLKVVDAIIKFFQKLPEPVKTLLNVLGGLTAIAGPLIMMAGVMGNFIGYVVKGIFHLRQLAKGGQGFRLLTPEIIAADAAAKGLATSFYSDTEATIVLSNAVNTLAQSFINLETKANAAKVAVQPAVSTVAGGVIMAAGGSGRVVDKNNPLVGRPYSRDMSHLIPSGNPQEGTIFGTVPGAKPVNIRVGRNPQAYMDGDLPKIPGLTSVGGTSTGIVAAEAAKWHAMTAAIAMQSEAELKILKAEVMATGTVTSSLSDSYKALLPEFSQITDLAAKETAAIVQQVQASKITVEQARAKIISLNATVEAMLAETTRLTAATMGRTANLTTVPLTSQPVVDPVTGKSNMKEMFHKGPTKAMVDRIARALGGVRTSGAGYNIETTKPRFAKGGFVPGTGDTDTYHTTAEPGAFVINKAATEKHLPLITNILGGKSYYAQEGGQVPVVLTPGEAVIPANIAKRNMPLMYELNGGPGNTSGSGMHEFGGETAFERSHVSEASAADLKRVRATRGYANSVSVGRGIPIWMSRDANQQTRSVGSGMTGPQLAKEFRKAIAAGRHPFEPWMTAAQGLGGDPRNNTQFNKVFNEMLRNLEKDSRVFGGKNGAMTFEKWFEKEVIGSKSFKDIRVGDRSFRSIFNSVLQPMGPRDGKPIAALETLVKSRNGLTTIENSKLAGLAKGMLGTFSGSSFNASRQRLAIMMSRAFLKRNAGGSIPGGTVESGRYGYGKPFFVGMPKTIKQVEEQRAKRVAMEKANQAVTDSRFAKTPVTQYGELLSPTSGRSFPVPGVGGLYMKGDEKVFVKPVLDERAAVAEMRATQIAREVHGLHAPTQKVVVMRDPTDPTGRRKLLALESKFDPKIAATDAKFTTDEYFRQLVASALRGDKDLARGNLSGNILSDVGPAGVFSAASGLRGYASVMPSVKEQAYINLLGRKGSGTKKFFAESTYQIPKGMTADEYHSRMLKEIESALPKLKQTVSRFDLNPEEKVVYEAMIRRLSDARGVNWKELHGIHSGLQMSPEKQMTPAAIAKMVAADELKRRQTGHSASLSDNAFKTDANGFRFGGLLEAITKSKAMHRIGAGFGPTGAPKPSTYESAPWGVTSLQIGMAEKLFGSTGLTKRTQKILYDKFAASLAKEMPYGYTKNAQGHLIRAVEPDVMDSVIRSAASSTLSAPEGRKVLSAIDREILRKKFANWESKKDTPLTETLKQLVFGIEKREMGGPVNSGQPYIVGEKGPELFVPRNAGGIIPNGYKAGGPINGYNPGGLVMMLKQLLLIMGISEGSKFAGNKIGGNTGDMVQMIGSFLPFLVMGGAMSGMGAKGKSISGMFPKATTPIGAVGSNKVTGVPQLTKYGTMLSKLTGSSNLLSKALGLSLGIFTKFNIALAVTAYGVKFAYDKWQDHKEALRLNALGYGMTAEAAQKAGLKFTNFNDKIKEAINNAKALREKNTLLYESMQGSGTPLKITIEEYKKLKKEVKENYSDQVALINQTGDNAEDQKALAIRLKEQLIAMGMSAEDAAKKIYTMYAASDLAPNAAAYTVRSQGFNDIKDTASAAASAIDSLTTAMETNRDATEQANQLNTAMMALSTDVESRQAKALKEARKKANKDGTYLSTGDEKQIMLDQEQAAIDEINSKVQNQGYLTKEVVDEMSKIDPAIRQIVNEQETALSLWQKTRIQVKGYTGDLRALNDQQTNDLYNLQISLGKSIEAANRAPGGALEKQYIQLNKNKELQAAYEKAAKGQSVAQQISDRDKISSIQKQIDANNKLTESRLKALDAAKQEGDIGREIAKKQAEYDAALATGNIAGAQQASLDIQGYQSELQYNSQKKSLEDSNTLKNLPLQKLIEAIQGKQQGIADKAALAGEKLGDLSKTIIDQETAIDSVNTAMLNWEIELLKQPEATRGAWKSSEASKKMLSAVADAAEKAGVKLNGLKDLDLAKALTDGLQNKLGAMSTIDVKGNVSIYVDGKKFEIGGRGSGTKDAPYDLGKAGVGTNTISKTTLADWSGIGGFGKLGTRQKVKDIAEERGILPGQFFSLTDGQGKIFVYKMGDKGQITEVTDPYKKADGGYIRGAGTATSDSIPAYLSNGEYVIKERAVRRYGVGTFDALNAEKFHKGGLAGHKHREFASPDGKEISPQGKDLETMLKKLLMFGPLLNIKSLLGANKQRNAAGEWFPTSSGSPIYVVVSDPAKDLNQRHKNYKPLLDAMQMLSNETGLKFIPISSKDQMPTTSDQYIHAKFKYGDDKGANAGSDSDYRPGRQIWSSTGRRETGSAYHTEEPSNSLGRITLPQNKDWAYNIPIFKNIPRDLAVHELIHLLSDVDTRTTVKGVDTGHAYGSDPYSPAAYDIMQPKITGMNSNINRRDILSIRKRFNLDNKPIDFSMFENFGEMNLDNPPTRKANGGLINVNKFHDGGPVGHKHLSAGHMASNYKAPAVMGPVAIKSPYVTDSKTDKRSNMQKAWDSFLFPLILGLDGLQSGLTDTSPVSSTLQKKYKAWDTKAKKEGTMSIMPSVMGSTLMDMSLMFAPSSGLVRSAVGGYGATKGIVGLEHLLPKGSIPYMGATTSKFVQSAIPAIMVGTARPFMDNLSPVMSSSTLRPPSISQQAARPGVSDEMTQTLTQSITPGEASRRAIQNQIDLATSIAKEEGRFAPRLVGTGNVSTITNNPRHLFTENLDGNVDDIMNWPWTPAIKTDAANPYANQSPKFWENLYTPAQIEKLSYKQKKMIAMLAGIKVPFGKPFPKITQTQLDLGNDAFYKNEELLKKWGGWSAYRDAMLKSVGLGFPAREKSRFVPYDEARALKEGLEDVRLKNADGTDSFAFKYTIGGPEADPRWSTAFGSKTSVIGGGAGDRGALMLDGDLGAALRRQYAIVYEDLIKTGFIRRARINKNGKRIETKAAAPLPYSPTADRYMGTSMTLDEFLLNVAAQLPGVTTSARLQTGTGHELVSRPSAFVQALNESYVKKVLGMDPEQPLSFYKYDIHGSPLVDDLGNPKAGGYYSLDEGFDYAINPGSRSYGTQVDPSTSWKNQISTKGKFKIDLLPREIPSPVFAGGGFTDEFAIIVPEWLALAKSKFVGKSDPSHFTKPMSADYGRYLHASRFFKPTEGWMVDDATAAAGGVFGTRKEQFSILADLLNTGKVKTSVLNNDQFGSKGAANKVRPWTEDDLWKIVTGYNTNAIIKEGNTRRINPDWLQGMSGNDYGSLEQMLKIEELINLMRVHIQDLPPISMVQPKIDAKPKMSVTVRRPGMADGGYVNPTYSANMSIPKFETGINNVPADMLAMLHKNEAVVPANMNPFNPNANNATMGGGVYNITNNINGYDGNLEQLSSMVTQKTITAIKSLDSRNAKMAGPSFTVGAK